MAEEKKKEKEKTLTEKLQFIQSELKAPKSQKNKFGNYMYRSCEDILEAVKPLLKETGTVLLLNDNIELIGDRHYVHAQAIFRNNIDDDIVTGAYAREPLARKGMDDAQLTGATSSYARKYALNGLFAIDDAKDPDTTNNGQNNNAKPIDKTLEIVEQAFFNFTTENQEALAEGFVFDKDKFIKAIVKHFKKLPTKEDSIKKITTTIKPAECIIEVTLETPSEGEQE